MAMPMLTDWWTRLEAAPRFGGPRRHLHDLLGNDVAGFLEGAGILRQGGKAPTFPCTERRGDNCPRAVIAIDGEYHAVCGNRPSECLDIVLTEHEAALLSIDMTNLCRGIGAALGIQGNPEVIRDLSGVHRVGFIVAGPGIRHPVFLVIRPSAQSYAEALGALSARQGGAPFVMLVPTDRFLTDGIERQEKDLGVAILVLTDVVEPHDGGFAATTDPKWLFASLGQRPASGLSAAGTIVARALICDGRSLHVWRDLDEKQYQALVTEADGYDVFADQRQRNVRKAGTVKDKIPNSHFNSILSAVTSRGHYDPNVSGPDLTAGKQIFQRARSVFDAKIGRSPWRMFHSVKHEEGHTVYAFRPEPGVSFAYVFFPED